MIWILVKKNQNYWFSGLRKKPSWTWKKISFYCKREHELMECFTESSVESETFVYCHNVKKLLIHMDHPDSDRRIGGSLLTVPKKEPEVWSSSKCGSSHKIHRKTPVPVSFLIKLQAETCNFILKKEFLAQVLSCEFCEIFKNTF